MDVDPVDFASADYARMSHLTLGGYSPLDYNGDIVWLNMTSSNVWEHAITNFTLDGVNYLSSDTSE